jgi:hypothetical protein
MAAALGQSRVQEAGMGRELEGRAVPRRGRGRGGGGVRTSSKFGVRKLSIEIGRWYPRALIISVKSANAKRPRGQGAGMRQSATLPC